MWMRQAAWLLHSDWVLQRGLPRTRTQGMPLDQGPGRARLSLPSCPAGFYLGVADGDGDLPPEFILCPVVPGMTLSL